MSRGSQVGSQQSAGSSGKLRTERSEILPIGWIYTVLGDVSTHPQYGWTCSSINNGTLKLLRTTDISDGRINWATVPFCTKEPDNDEKYLLKDNDILVSRAGSVGISYRITKDDLFHRTVFASYLIRFCPFIPASFVEHYFKSHNYWQFISDSQLGIAVPNVNATKLSELPFPLPPLSEQKRIVARLDKIMPRIDAVKERLNKVPSIIKRFKQSVLTAAVTGKLTEKWRAEHPDAESAEVLLERIKTDREIRYKKECEIAKKNGCRKPKKIHLFCNNEIELPFDAPISWKNTTLGNIVYDFCYGTSDKADYDKKGTPVVRIPNVLKKYLDLSDLKFLDSIEKNVNNKITENDILIIRSNGSKALVGKNCIVPFLEKDYAFASYLIRIRPAVISANYVFVILNAPIIKEQFFSTSKSSAGINNINTEELAAVTLALPPLEEQKEIVRQVDKLFALADRLESHYQKAKARVDKLSQSVLAKAFRGELVITEAELAEKEGRDFESAEKLLERILEEKAKLVGSRQRTVRSVRSAKGSKGKQKETGRKKK